jgi:uroporphyrinogen decarboxylase
VHEAGKDVWLHSCGKIEAILDDLIEMGVDVLNPVQPECMDIYRLKDKYGSRITFWGGISTQQTLPYGTPDEVRAEVDRVVTTMSRGGGYITSPAQDLQADVPLENVLALIEQARSYA